MWVSTYLTVAIPATHNGPHVQHLRWGPDSKPSQQHPRDGQLINQLPQKAQRCVEIDGAGSHHHQQDPDCIDTGTYVLGVVSE